MTFKELIYTALWERYPSPELMPYLQRVIDEAYSGRRSGFTSEDVDSIYAEARKKLAQEPRKVPVEILMKSLRQEITTDQICAAWQGEISNIRKSLLGRREPLPVAEAEKWVGKQIKENLKLLNTKTVGGPVAKRAQEKTGFKISFELAGTSYPMKSAKNGEKLVAVPLCFGTTLYKAVYGPIKRLAKRTGFHEGGVLNWVLTGIHPGSEPVEAVVTRRSPFPGDQELRDGVEVLAWVGENIEAFKWVANFVELMQKGKKREALETLEQNRDSLSSEEQKRFDSYAKQTPFYRELTEVTLRFRSKPTWRGLSEMFQQIHEHLDSVPPLHLKIFELVQEAGEPGTRWDRRYWEQIRDRLVAEGFDVKGRTFEGIAKAYYKLKAKSEEKKGRKGHGKKG